MTGLLNLLMGQQATPAPANEIVVPGVNSQYDPRQDPQRPVFNDPANREPVDPRYVLNDDRMSPHPDELEEIVPRSGMFGVKGTLRDILGTVGDAFLAQGGRDAVYRPQRQQERQADAVYGFSENPLQAIERLAAAGFPEEAQQLLQQTQEQEYRQGVLGNQQANAERQQQNTDSLVNGRSFDILQDLTNYSARLLNSTIQNPELFETAINQIERQAARQGLSLEDLGLSRAMTDAQIRMYASGDMTVNQQEGLQRRDRGLDQGDERNDIQRQGLGIRREDVSRDNDRADRTQRERERRNRVVERQSDERNEISRNRGTSRRRTAPGTSTPPRYVRQNGVLFDTTTGQPVPQ